MSRSTTWRAVTETINGWLDRLFPPAPIRFTSDTFIVWEPCTHSHAEVVPGYVNYLLDLGFKVAVFATPARFDEGLFCRFDDPRVSLHRLSQWSIRRQFRCHGMGEARGVMVTTARKISGAANYALEQQWFARRRSSQHLLLVEHDVKAVVDSGDFTPDIITLRAPNYRSAQATVVNPHYFGIVQRQKTQAKPTRFITIGALRARRRNTQLLLDSVAALHADGERDFVITVIGRGSLRGIPTHLQRYFDLRGRLDFAQLYAAVEQADYFLPLLDPDNTSHERYLTTGTSGSFQLIMGFGRPPVLAEKFATPNGFDQGNAIIYGSNSELVAAMARAMHADAEAYQSLQKGVLALADRVYQQSLNNLRQRVSPSA